MTIALFILSKVAWTGEAARPDGGTAAPEGVFSGSALKDDLDFLMQTLEDVHPNLYAFTPRPVVQRLVAGLRTELDRPMAEKVFGRRIAQIVAALQDGHTRVELAHDNSGTGLVFPLRLRKDADKIVVAGRFSDRVSIPVCAEILSINHTSVKEIWQQIAAVTSAERLEYRDYLVGGQFPLDLWNICQIDSPYEIEFLVAGTRQKERHVLNGIAYEAYSTALGVDRHRGPPFEFEILPEKIGLLRWRRCQDLGGFIAFLQSTFAGIKESGIPDLVIDLRENGGGTSLLGSELLKWLATGSVRQNARVETKVSRQNIEWWEKGIFERMPLDDQTKRIIEQYAAELKSKRIGDVFIEPGEVEKPGEGYARFGGCVWVLIGTQTFSSATSFAAVIKDNKLGTLVGEETGGLASCFGDCYYFRLPNTRIEVAVSQKYFVRPGGFDDRRGVLPDYEVHEAPIDALPPRDAVLARTIELIRADRQRR